MKILKYYPTVFGIFLYVILIHHLISNKESLILNIERTILICLFLLGILFYFFVKFGKHCTECGNIISGKKYFYKLKNKIIHCPNCGIKLKIKRILPRLYVIICSILLFFLLLISEYVGTDINPSLHSKKLATDLIQMLLWVGWAVSVCYLNIKFEKDENVRPEERLLNY